MKNNVSIAVIMLHGGCNMTCSFCITEDRMECMSRFNYVHVLDRLQEHGLQNIVLGGGEPFLWPDGLGVAAKMAKERGFFVQVGTNGVLMPDRDVHCDSVDRYVIPMDGADAEKHNTVRRLPKSCGGDGHYGIIRKRLYQLKEWRRSVTLSTVVSRTNLDDIGAIGDFLADYVAGGGRLHAWHLYCFIPRGRGGSQSAAALGITLYEFNEAVSRAKSQNYPFVIYKRSDMRHSATVDFFWFQNARLHVGSEEWGRARTRFSNLASK